MENKFVPHDDDYNVIILGMAVERDLPHRSNDIRGLLNNELMPKRNGRRAVVYFADIDTTERGETAHSIGNDVLVVGKRIKETARPRVDLVAREIGIYGRVDAALSDWSSPSFYWKYSWNGDIARAMRYGGVVFIRHVHRKIISEYSDREIRNMKLTGMTGGSYAQQLQEFKAWKEIIRERPAVTKRIEILSSQDKELPQEFPLHHDRDEISSLFQYLRWRKVPKVPIANRG